MDTLETIARHRAEKGKEAAVRLDKRMITHTQTYNTQLYW